MNAGVDGFRVPIRKKLIILAFVAVVNFMGGLVWSERLNSITPGVIGLSITIACAAVMGTMRCPRCGTPVLKRRVRCAGMEWTYWGGFLAPKWCSTCRFSFLGDEPVRHFENSTSS